MADRSRSISSADRKKAAAATMAQLASVDPARASAKQSKQTSGGKGGSTASQSFEGHPTANARAQALAEEVFKKAIADGEAKLAEYAHPDPYTVPTAYGGSKYARNPPPHPDVKVVMDFGRDEYVIPRS